MKIILKPTSSRRNTYRVFARTSDFNVDEEIGKAHSRDSGLRNGEIDVYLKDKSTIEALQYEYNKQKYDKKARQDPQNGDEPV